MGRGGGGGGYRCKKLLFHLILQNACLDFNKTWEEASFGVGDLELCKWYTHGPRGRAPIAFLIDDIPLGAPQGAYVNSGER